LPKLVHGEILCQPIQCAKPIQSATKWLPQPNQTSSIVNLRPRKVMAASEEVTKRLTNSGKRHRLPLSTIALKHLKTSPRLTSRDVHPNLQEFSSIQGRDQ
jgi:biotin synthase-related radical SAM superfamily protein